MTPTDNATVTVEDAILAIIDDLPGIGKDGRNEQQRYNFRGIEQLTTELSPLLVRHGVVIVPVAEHLEREHHTTGSGNVMHHSVIQVDWEIRGPGGDCLHASTFGEGCDVSDKATNKAMTSAYKYLILDLFCVCDPMDDGERTTPEAATASGETSGKPQPSRSSPVRRRNTPAPVAAAPEPPKVSDVAIAEAPFTDNELFEEQAVEAAKRVFPGAQEISERLYLTVPYKEKDDVKALGARWDKDAKAWYIPENHPDPLSLEKWVVDPADAA